jgi:hypothetical protein
MCFYIGHDHIIFEPKGKFFVEKVTDFPLLPWKIKAKIFLTIAYEFHSLLCILAIT